MTNSGKAIGGVLTVVMISFIVMYLFRLLGKVQEDEALSIAIPDEENLTSINIITMEKMLKKGMIKVETDTSLAMETCTSCEGEMFLNLPDKLPKIYQDFYISIHEITVGQFVEFLNQANKRNWLDIYSLNKLTENDYIYRSNDIFRVALGYENYPMTNITWKEAQEFCEFYGGRLPTAKEWQYAAIGGLFGNNTLYSGSRYINGVAWYQKNAKPQVEAENYGIHYVCQKKKNELGIYDMSGNVAEMCSNTRISSMGEKRCMIRGGSWSEPKEQCKVFSINYIKINERANNVGFRMVMDVKK